MNVPQSQNLHSQSFNSEYLEFVWEFPVDKLNEKTKFPTSFDSKLVTIRLVYNINKTGNVIIEPWLHDVFDNCEMYVTDEIGINDFISNEELVTLKNQAMEYLK